LGFKAFCGRNGVYFQEDVDFMAHGVDQVLPKPIQYEALLKDCRGEEQDKSRGQYEACQRLLA
jgi:hypothetical protein